MAQITHDALIQAYKKEKDPQIKEKIHAVCLIKIHNYTTQEVADILYCSSQTIRNWLERFDSEGLVGLEDRPRSGRPRKLPLKKIEKIILKLGTKVTPKILRNKIFKKFKVKYHITVIRKILTKLNMSPKVPKHIHVNRADIEEIRRWQKNAKRRISRLEKEGHVTLIQDESVYMYDATLSKKYWSPKGQNIILPYNGKHQNVVAYGAVSTDGRKLFRCYSKFNAKTFLKFLKLLQRHFKKITITMDKAPQHTAKSVTEYIKNNPNIKAIYLPTATPELSMIEEYWNQSKYALSVSEYYETFEHMKRALSKYLRTTPVTLDLMKYLTRKAIMPKDF